MIVAVREKVRHGLYCPTTNHNRFSSAAFGRLPPRIQKLTWLIRIHKHSIFFPACALLGFFFFVCLFLNPRGSEPSAHQRDENLRGWFSAWGVVGILLMKSREVGRGSVAQPSIPKSSVNFLTFSRSSVLTVGRVVDRDRSMSDCKQKGPWDAAWLWSCLIYFDILTKHGRLHHPPRLDGFLTMQTIGSKSLSLGTSIQVISMAAGSPGEQGVRRSSTITWLLLRDGPRTCGKQGAEQPLNLWRTWLRLGKPWINADLFEVCGGLDLPDGLHESVPDDDADVRAGVTVRLVGELPQVGVAQAVRGVAQVEAEHLSSGWLLWQRDIDALLKPSTHTHTHTRSHRRYWVTLLTLY